MGGISKAEDSGCSDSFTVLTSFCCEFTASGLFNQKKKKQTCKIEEYGMQKSSLLSPASLFLSNSPVCVSKNRCSLTHFDYFGIM